MSLLSNKKHWLEEQKERYGDNTALLFGNSKITFQELFEQCSSLAFSLRQFGIGSGDKIALLFKHSSEIVFTINALWLAGAIPVLINTKNRFEEIKDQIEFADTKILITDEVNYEKVKSLISIKVVLFSQLNLRQLREKSDNNFQPENRAIILFTSGSTSKPKAVIHTFNNLYHSVQLTCSVSPLSGNDLWLASLPFYHIGGLMIMVRALVTGAALSLSESTSYIQIKEALDKFNPSHISLVSTTLKQLLDVGVTPNQNLKYVYLGGGRIDSTLCRLAIDNGFPVIKVYGSTETCSMISALPANDFTVKPESAGKPLDDVIIKIINDRNEFAEPLTKGEIVIRSKTIMQKYYNNEEETLHKIKNEFYHTGDYGWLDNDGYLYIDLRREDLIVTGGENVNPKEVEQFLIQLPSITDAFVFAEPDEKWGQIVCAVVVCSNIITEDELKEQLRNMMANYKVPKKFYFIDRIPRSELGKVEKHKLIASLR